MVWPNVAKPVSHIRYRRTDQGLPSPIPQCGHLITTRHPSSRRPPKVERKLPHASDSLICYVIIKTHLLWYTAVNKCEQPGVDYLLNSPAFGIFTMNTTSFIIKEGSVRANL